MNNSLKLSLLLAVPLSLFVIGSSTFASEVTGNLSTGINSTVGNTVDGIVMVPPTASVPAGTYTTAQSVALNASGSSSIHYTINGDAPTCLTDTIYSGLVSVGSSMIIKAISCYPGDRFTTVASYQYVINIPASTGGGGGGGGGGGSSNSETVAPVTVVPVVVPPVVVPEPQPTVIEPQVLGVQVVDVTSLEQSLMASVDNALTRRLAGRILLQVENHGEAWYLDPSGLKKYYLANGSSAYTALRTFGLGITNVDLKKIPIGTEKRFVMTDSDNDGLPDKLEEAIGTNPNLTDTDNDGISDGQEVLTIGTNPLGTGSITRNSSLVNRLKGKILLQVESRGEAWYVNPVDGKRYYMADGNAAYQIMRYLSLGITNSNLRKISVGDIDAVRK